MTIDGHEKAAVRAFLYEDEDALCIEDTQEVIALQSAHPDAFLDLFNLDLAVIDIFLDYRQQRYVVNL